MDVPAEKRARHYVMVEQHGQVFDLKVPKNYQPGNQLLIGLKRNGQWGTWLLRVKGPTAAAAGAPEAKAKAAAAKATAGAPPTAAAMAAAQTAADRPRANSCGAKASAQEAAATSGAANAEGMTPATPLQCSPCFEREG